MLKLNIISILLLQNKLQYNHIFESDLKFVIIRVHTNVYL